MKKTLALLSALLLAGCFEIDQSIELKKDLSGTADATRRRHGADGRRRGAVRAKWKARKAR
jgi:hypothetical protein